MIALTAGFFFAQEALRRAPLILMWALFGLATIALTPYWLYANNFDAFLWIKIYSIMFCVCWGSWLRLTSHGSRKWLLRTFAILLAANILEAVVVDLMSEGLAHRLNALAGLILIGTISFGDRSVSIDTTNNLCDLRFDTSLKWISGYTIWNWSFVYLNYPGMTGYHTAILCVALIVGAIDSQRWLQTRAATLGLCLMATATSYSGTILSFNASAWFSEEVSIAVAAFALTWMAFYLAEAAMPIFKRALDDSLTEEFPRFFEDSRSSIVLPNSSF